MKAKLFLFSVLALLLFSSTGLKAQTLEFENKSECLVVVQLTASENTCKPQCQTGFIFLQPNSTTQIALPPCGPGPFVTPTQFFQIDYSAGGVTGTIGLGCGLTQSNSYIDCQGDPRTIIMNNAWSATIF